MREIRVLFSNARPDDSGAPSIRCAAHHRATHVAMPAVRSVPRSTRSPTRPRDEQQAALPDGLGLSLR
jgi:hypothetical protein